IQPFLDQMVDAYGGVKTNFEGLNNLLQNFQN
ncbi:MAG: hypothetical protein UV85_C0024G0009, partial [Candidatus Nomurabacteria bacterium GW2011_GWB1_43_19]